jgi:quercetin dioxygenase-like cupin family protein
MIVKKLSEAKEYVAPNHRQCTTLRLFGAEAGVSKAIVAGVSHFLPGGGAGPDASPPEKVYYVLEGELTVIVGGKETVLKKNESCFIGPNESREIVNRTNEVCTIFVAVAVAAGVMTRSNNCYGVIARQRVCAKRGPMINSGGRSSKRRGL